MYNVYLKIFQTTVERPRPNINIRTFYYRNMIFPSNGCLIIYFIQGRIINKIHNKNIQKKKQNVKYNKTSYKLA